MDVPALSIALSVVLAGAIVLVIARRTADGRLSRNHLAGLRTKATLASDEAWSAAHVAARPSTERGAMAGLAGGALGLLLIIAAPTVGIGASLVGLFVMFGGVVAGAVAGQRAAKAVRPSTPALP